MQLWLVMLVHVKLSLWPGGDPSAAYVEHNIEGMDFPCPLLKTSLNLNVQVQRLLSVTSWADCFCHGQNLLQPSFGMSLMQFHAQGKDEVTS